MMLWLVRTFCSDNRHCLCRAGFVRLLHPFNESPYRLHCIEEYASMLQIVRRVFAVALAAGLTVLGTQLAGCSRESSQPQQTPSPPLPTAGVTTPAPPAARVTPSRPSDFSLHEPAQRAMPSVVNIFTSKRLRTRRPTLPEGSP